jgi:hypothetical protein
MRGLHLFVAFSQQGRKFAGTQPRVKNRRAIFVDSFSADVLSWAEGVFGAPAIKDEYLMIAENQSVQNAVCRNSSKFAKCPPNR